MLPIARREQSLATMKILVVLLLVHYVCSDVSKEKLNNTRKRMEALTLQLIRDDNDLMPTRNAKVINQETNRETVSKNDDLIGTKLSSLLSRGDLTKYSRWLDRNRESQIRMKQRALRMDTGARSDDQVSSNDVSSSKISSRIRSLQNDESTRLREGHNNSNTPTEFYRNLNVLNLIDPPTNTREAQRSLDILNLINTQTSDQEGHRSLNVLDLIDPPTSDREGHRHLNDLIDPPTSDREGHRHLNDLIDPPTSDREGHRHLNNLIGPPTNDQEGFRNLNVLDLIDPPTSPGEKYRSLNVLDLIDPPTTGEKYRSLNVLDLIDPPTSTGEKYRSLNVLDLIDPPTSEREEHKPLNVLDLIDPPSSKREGHRSLNVLDTNRMDSGNRNGVGHKNVNVRNLVNSQMQYRNNPIGETVDSSRAGRLLYSLDNDGLWTVQTKDKLIYPLQNIDNRYNSISASKLLKQSLANSIIDKSNLLKNDLALLYHTKPTIGLKTRYKRPTTIGYPYPLKDAYGPYLHGVGPKKFVTRVSSSYVGSVAKVNHDRDTSNDNRSDKDSSDEKRNENENWDTSYEHPEVVNQKSAPWYKVISNLYRPTTILPWLRDNEETANY